MNAIVQNLLERAIQFHRYSTISWDEETAAFELHNLSGQLVGYQQYRPTGDKKQFNNPKEGRYFTYCKDNIGVWGLETLGYRHDVLFVVEGVFDCVKLHNLNLPAIAVLANDPKKIRPWVNSLARTTVAICDNDTAGRKLGKLCQHRLHVVGEKKDLGEMSNEQVRDFIKFYCPLVWA
jgi:hypothetical protein